ncbi:17043_t:CDS:2 [Funneliformis geosporum]|uniref:1166_t:CDS:1 n=1 Tax=Funneliformis geosporum TaxID=1117311 RepID=A0A9W4SK81_9GLOM|nr:17043_t:CDS:2 [Funneliformis geosporum]CAI2171332.1 1166_t:CDS:2 [Funneliformis geosporum]
MSNIISNVVKRPVFGHIGRHIKVKTNFFEITTLTDSNIHYYEVLITPHVQSSILKRRIFSQFETLHAGDIKLVFDGAKNMFTTRPLPFGEKATYTICLTELPNTLRPRTFEIIIRKVNVINMKEIHKFLNGRCKSSSNILTGIMALNVLIRQKPFLTCKAIGRLFYTNQISQACFSGLEIWQGYRQTIRPKPGSMMINIDVSAAHFYESGDLVLMVAKILDRKLDDLRRGITDRDRLILEKALKGLKIHVTQRGDGSERTYKIIKLTNTSASNTRFDFDGSSIDIASYFQNTFNMSLQFPSLPCVVTRIDVSLPMEVCKLVEGQHIRSLNYRQAADMTKFTIQRPSVRANKIIQGLEILDYRENEYMRQFGLNVSEEMAVVPARVLPAPTLRYHPSSRDSAFVPRNGSWNLINKKVTTGVTLGSWSCVAFGNLEIQAIQHFIKELIDTCQNIGIVFPNKNPPIMRGNPLGNIEQTLKQAWIKAGNVARSPPQLILCILPNSGAPLYAEIKRVCDTVIGVATQCAQVKHVHRAKKQYCANLCLKMNVKLGGMNSFIEPNQMKFVSERPTIIMGAHRTPGGDETCPSIAALCASMDAKAYRYAATTRVQTGKPVIISDLVDMVKELLKTFYQTCGRSPERILFYRHGVSDGQFHQMFFEVKAIRDACSSLNVNYRPTITYVVVQKGHHTRFFPMAKRHSDRAGNCLVGTVVESTITPFEFDFYLQSHAATQGTSLPTHYYVLHDENKFDPDSLQTLSYNLCYSNVRCTRAISIVPPVYYAHLVCSRARFHSRGENWNDRDSECLGFATDVKVKPDLQKVMYFM